MRFDILTLFPETFEGFLKASLIGKAIANKKITVELHDIRTFTSIAHRQADNKPYGGGPGMVMMAEPIYQALKYAKTKGKRLQGKKFSAVMSARGARFSAAAAAKLATYRQIILLCGHYEGIDERAVSRFDAEISMGPYVLMGGETAAMTLIEAVARHVPGVIKESASLKEESHSIIHNGRTLLEWPQYTRPKSWRGKKVPDVLTSGNHRKIDSWRWQSALTITDKMELASDASELLE
ncbi:MAG: tRNA (guanosine(37)-N1)-methyltransferase TrmD [Elusimicrobiota bacterium]